MISKEDMPSDSPEEIQSNSPYNPVSRLTASRSSPSLTSQLKDDDSLHRTESLPTPKEVTSPTKPSMPWLMPSSTRGAGGFVASAALKRSSTLGRATPTVENTDIRTRPATMYARSGHQRNFGGSLSYVRSPSPNKEQFPESDHEKSTEEPLERESLDKSISTTSTPAQGNIEETKEGNTSTTLPHETPSLSRPETNESTSVNTSSPSQIKQSSSPPPLSISISTSTESASRKRWSPTKSSWLDSALQKASDPAPGSPPKRTNSIRPIAPAVPSQPSVGSVSSGVGKWSN
jgi:hypothetical protein